MESALELGIQASRTAEQGDPVELKNRKLDLAKLYLRAGRPAEALDLLPLVDLKMPSGDYKQTSIFAETLIKLGNKSAAQNWLALFYRQINAHNLEHLRPQADALAQQL